MAKTKETDLILQLIDNVDLLLEGLQLAVENQTLIIKHLSKQRKQMDIIDEAIERLESKP